MRVKSVVLTLIGGLTAFNACADGITIEPGSWEMTSTMSMPMLPQPRVTTVTECMEESEITPESMTDEMDSSCTFDVKVVEGNTMNWSMDCSGDEGSSRGEWHATSYGDTLEGAGTITIDVQGQDMVMTMNWTGKRVGACN
jgi:hypothetical protein